MSPVRLPRSIAAGISVLLGACASTAGTETAPLASAGAETRPPEAAGAYSLSEEELKLDCKKLIGRMQVRIIQAREYDSSRQSTGLSRALQTATTTVIGGSKEGTSPDSRHARDIAMLEAYNKQLAAKGCRTFNLEAELKSTASSNLPAPVARPSTH